MKKEEAAIRQIKHVQSIERALNILELMAEIGEPVAVTDLAEKLDLKISTTHRLLTTLMHRGYVEQEPENSRYRLGLKVLEIANAALSLFDIRTMVHSFLEELVERCNETANLAVLDETEIVYIDQVESHNYIIVKMFAQVGNRNPVHCTASGKTLLAYQSEKKIKNVLSNIELTRHTDKTIVDREILREELARIKKTGYAIDFGELEEHVRCVAAPIFNYEGKAAASLSVSGPSNRIDADFMKNELASLVMAVAAKASRKLGWKGKN
ncbi:MAG: IclR family transcriptional regulator [Firmicutes bacterium ML8_F2]|nr:MAG: IclR family transcriptional regulator [Firmicutes bacterium ML8_F2]